MPGKLCPILPVVPHRIDAEYDAAAAFAELFPIVVTTCQATVIMPGNGKRKTSWVAAAIEAHVQKARFCRLP
jgi:hypothetical protein